MESKSLSSLAGELLERARGAPAGRAASTLTPGEGPGLKQTLLALVVGQGLADHDSPGPATLQVLQGRVRLTAGEDSLELGAADHAMIPPSRHALDALDDSVVLLTVAQPPVDG